MWDLFLVFSVYNPCKTNNIKWKQLGFKHTTQHLEGK